MSLGSCVEGMNYGALFIVVSCALYATYQVDAKVLSRTEPVNLIVFWTMVLSAPMALAVAVFLACFITGRVITLRYYTAPRSVHLDMVQGEKPKTE